MTQSYPCRLRNATGRPVELHRGHVVEVLVPGATLDLDGPDPVAEHLVLRGVLTRHELFAPVPEMAPAKAQAKAPAKAKAPKASATPTDIPKRKSPTTKGTPRQARTRNAESGGTR